MNSRTRHLTSLLFGTLLLLTPPSASAQDDFSGNLEIGTTLFRLGKDEKAVIYLERAAEARPDDSSALIPLGISLSRLGRHEEAVTVLERAELKGTLGADGAWYLGESWKALGNREAARHAYQLAAELGGPLSTRALLESGRMALTLGDLQGAERDFERVLQLQAAGDLAAEARAGLSEVSRRRSTRLAVNVDAGIRYDSNVLLSGAPTSDDRGFRAVVNGQGRYRFIETQSLRSEGAVVVNQGRYFDPDHRALDLGVHQAQADLTWRPGKLPLRLGGLVRAEYWTLDFHFYKRAIGVGPRLLVAMGENFATAASWEWRLDDFRSDERDGINRRAQLNQFAFWGKTGYAGIGASYETNRAADDFWIYDLLSARIFGGGDVGAGILVDGSFEYLLTPYLAESVDRTDRALSAALGVSRWWGDWGVRLSTAWIRNENVRAPEIGVLAGNYTKWLGGLEARWRMP